MNKASEVSLETVSVLKNVTLGCKGDLLENNPSYLILKIPNK